MVCSMNPLTAEKFLLASVVLNFYAPNFRKLDAKCFRSKACKFVFNTITELYQGSVEINLRSVHEALRASTPQDIITSIGEVLTFIKDCYSEVDFDHFFAIVRKEKIKHESAAKIQDAFKKLTDENESPEATIASLISDLQNLCTSQSSQCYSIAELSQNFRDGKTYAEIVQQRRLNYLAGKSNFIGVETGYHKLDGLIGGFSEGSYNIIAASTSAGKTTYMMNVIVNILSVKPQSRILFLTLEMTPHDIYDKLIGAYTQIDPKRLNEGNITQTEMEMIINVDSLRRGSNLVLDGSVPADMNYIHTKTNQLIQQHGCDLVFVDYLTLVKSVGKYSNKHLEIDSISKGLQQLAKKTKVPIVALAQLNRNMSQRNDPTPQLGDIRESGSIEEDADTIIMLDRPNRGKDNDFTYVHVKKNRNFGNLGTIRMRFEYGRLFEDQDIEKTLKATRTQNDVDAFSRFNGD